MSPEEEMTGMLERVAERALDNMEQYGFHLPLCLGLTPTGERTYVIAEPSGEEVDLEACEASVLEQTRRMIAEGQFRAVAFATVERVTLADDTGAETKADAVKILLDHAEQPGYTAYLTFSLEDAKAEPGEIVYDKLPARFFAEGPSNG